MSMFHRNEALPPWLPELRERLQRGELRDLGAVDVGGGFELPDGEKAVRAMLEALDRYRAHASVRYQLDPVTRARMELLLHDLERVRQRVDV